MAIATDSPTQQIINEIHAYIQKCGGLPKEWYVGIANSRDRLFVDHNVAEIGGVWIYRIAPSEAVARAVEQAFLNWGCEGGSGGGDNDTTIVYAYRINSATQE